MFRPTIAVIRVGGGIDVATNSTPWVAIDIALCQGVIEPLIWLCACRERYAVDIESAFVGISAEVALI
jgi:hypothetical protein